MVPWSHTISNNKRNSKNFVTIRKLSQNPSSATCLNGPKSSPDLCSDHEQNSCYGREHLATNEEDEHCRSCNSTAMVTDWSQGDRICTNCGVVAQSRLVDDRPEWKNFNDAEDIVKGLPSNSRSGLVPVDERKYVGGLQPTTLSKNAFGENSGGYKMTKIRKQLKTTNKRLDHLMCKVHKRALYDSQIDRRVRLKKEIEKEGEGDIGNLDFNSSVRPEFDMIVVQEEEDARRLQAAIYADKWSLDKAVLLYGTSEDYRGKNYSEVGDNREDLLSQMDTKLRIVSRDLYYSYSMLTEAARKLNLPIRVTDQAIHRLVHYVTRRDGFLVKGVSSRLSKGNRNESTEDRKAAAVRLREYNKVKQMTSLGAAIIFLTARNLGWTRTVVEICGCIHLSLEYTNETILIKPKHFSCAMNEIKAYFPEYASMPTLKNAAGDSSKIDSISTSNFSDHFIRNLQLPPVAEASIRVLLVHCRREQMQLGRNSGTKLSTLCAVVAFFVCEAGAVMQKVAKQVQLKDDGASKTSSRIGSERKRFHFSHNKHMMTSAPKDIDKKSAGKLKEKIKVLEQQQDSTNSDDDDEEEGFDVFTHAAVVENKQEKLEYDMRRMWDAWAEQMPWSRSLLEIEQSRGVSKNVVLNLYKTDIYPRKECLLSVLRDAVSMDDISRSQCVGESGTSLRHTPLASILLSHISTSLQ